MSPMPPLLSYLDDADYNPAMTPEQALAMIKDCDPSLKLMWCDWLVDLAAKVPLSPEEKASRASIKF